MKVVIIGSGAQGTGLAGLLAGEQDVERLVLADYAQGALDASAALIDTLGERRRVRDIAFARVDAADTADVARVIRGSDIVFNATIPAFNLPIMRAALAEKAHYLDLFAAAFAEPGVAHEETIGAQFELNDAFAAAGLTALPSQGATPGWTTLVAQDAIEQLDTVESVDLRFYYHADTDVFYCPVAPTIFLNEWLGAPHPVRSRDGRPEAVDLIGSEEAFDFLAPLGRRKVYTVTAAPDVVLIPRFAGKPVGRVEQKAGVGIGRLDTKDILVKALQQATAAQGGRAGEVNIVAEMAKAFIPPIQFEALLREGAIRDEASTVTVEVVGERDGKRTRHLSYLTAELAEARARLPWSSPAVLSTIGALPVELVLALGRGRLTRRGVLSPTQIDDRAFFLRQVEARGLKVTNVVVAQEQHPAAG